MRCKQLKRYFFSRIFRAHFKLKTYTRHFKMEIQQNTSRIHHIYYNWARCWNATGLKLSIIDGICNRHCTETHSRVRCFRPFFFLFRGVFDLKSISFIYCNHNSIINKLIGDSKDNGKKKRCTEMVLLGKNSKAKYGKEWLSWEHEFVAWIFCSVWIWMELVLFFSAVQIG